ncbi:iron-containing alcohol dehydrogenase [Haloplanus salinarum]|uniref:iron-containing alcohol dehydrogenase family protein n=1 Tax=Haloplanus salinarum TaxID=1912324 RepID=UPI003B43BF2E
MDFEFTHGPKVVSGTHSSRNIDSYLEQLGTDQPLIVTDPDIESAGLLDPVLETLDAAGREYVLFDEVKSNPTTTVVKDGTALAREESADCVVAIGGGSAIDTGKAISLLIPNGGDWVDYEGVPDVSQGSLPLIAVPTTVGTGSEVTHVNVITDVNRDVKMTTATDELFPDIAILDPSLLESLPPAVTAATGMDSLTQAVEAYISPGANPITDALAIEATRMIGQSLRPAVSGTDMEALGTMQVATTMEGIAFHNAGLGLVHGMSEPVSGKFHTGHGITNAILLPEVLEFNLIACPDRYARLAEAMGEQTDGLSTRAAADRFVDAVRTLAADIKIPPGLSDIGAEEAAISDLVDEAYDHVDSENNPREYTRDDLAAIYERAF